MSAAETTEGTLGDATIRTVRLSKWYGKVTALQDVSLHLHASGPNTSGIWGLLGPNGSGKSTFLGLAAGQLRPSLGSIRVGGVSPFANPNVLAHIGLCPEADALYDDLSGLEFVSAMARLSGCRRQESRDRAAAALERFGLKNEMHRPIGGYSRGMRQRTKLAQATVHEPRVLLLDEPLTGTDPKSRSVILDQIRERAAQGCLVVFSTHVLHEVEALTEQVLLIARGQLVAHGHVHEIRDLLEEHPHHIRVVCSDSRRLAARLASEEQEIVGIRFPSESCVEFETTAPEATYAAITKALVQDEHRLESITSPDATLEALFHYLVARGTHGAGTGADAEVGQHSPSPSLR